MLISLEIAGIFMPLAAPVGASCFTVKHIPKGKDGSKTERVSVLFGMIRLNENGAQANNRISKKYPNVAWKSASAAASEQKIPSPLDAEFLALDFEFDEENQNWKPRTRGQGEYVSAALREVGSSQPGTKDMAATVEDWVKQRHLKEAPVTQLPERERSNNENENEERQ